MKNLRTQLGVALILLARVLASDPAQGAVIAGSYHPLSAEIQYLSDPAGALTLEHVLAAPSAHPFVPSTEGKPDSSFDPVWLRIELEFSESARDKRYYLFSRVENLYEIRMYRPDGQGGYSEWLTGNRYPAASREVDSPRYGFLVEPSDAAQTLYIRYIGGPGTNQLPWDLIEEEAYLEGSGTYYSLEIAAFSAIATLLVFNLFIALSLRKAEYLFYSCYVLSVAMGLATVDGLGFYYLWPDSPALNERALHSFNLISSSTRLLTILSFLGVAAFAPRLHRAALIVLGILATGFVALNTVGVTRLPPYSLTIPWAIGILFGFVVCGYAVWKGVRLAIPLFITLLIPGVAAISQAFLTVNVSGVGVMEMQIAKIGFVVHVLMFSLCLAAEIKIETESRILALHDSLTGLPGAALLQERFDVAASLCRRQGMKTAVFFIDLDGFKVVNDTMGHAVGDQLLVQVASRIQMELRRADTVARIGGDEFAVLLTQLDEDGGASHVADKLLTSLAKPYFIDGQQAAISASIGISISPDQGEDLQRLLEMADGAMYDAKRGGKNAYSLSRARPNTHPSNIGKLRRLADSQSG